MGTEAAARELRYAFLTHCADEHGYDWIATAHTADDNAETLLRRAVLLCQADSEELRPTLAELHACLGMVAETQQISIKNIL